MVSSKNVTCSGTCYCQYYNDISKEGYLNIIKSQYIISVVPIPTPYLYGVLITKGNYIANKNRV